MCILFTMLFVSYREKKWHHSNNLWLLIKDLLGSQSQKNDDDCAGTNLIFKRKWKRKEHSISLICYTNKSELNTHNCERVFLDVDEHIKILHDLMQLARTLPRIYCNEWYIELNLFGYVIKASMTTIGSSVLNEAL